MNQKKIAGIDYSLTSPAICVYKEEDGGYFDFDRCVFHYLFNSERQRQLATRSGLSNLKAEPYPEWKTAEERHEKLTAWAYRIVQGCEEVYLEGYAFATAAQAGVRSIAENTGLLKHKMWKNKISYSLSHPSHNMVTVASPSSQIIFTGIFPSPAYFFFLFRTGIFGARSP